MLQNYLKIALRNLRRHRAYAFINVTGLAVGIACCLLILLFVRDELSYDRFHDRADRIYRIVSEWSDFSVPSTNPPTVMRLRADYPELKVAQLWRFQGLVRAAEAAPGDQNPAFPESRMLFVNPEFYEVFSFRLLRGDPATALAQPFTAVITEEAARRYFGAQDPIGRTLVIDARSPFEVEVTGVTSAAPPNAHFHFEILVSWATLDGMLNLSTSTNWGNNSIYTYLLLPEGYAPETLEAQLPAFIERHAGKSWNGAKLSLQPLTQIHLHSHHNMELEPNGRMAYVYLFSVVALFILLVACINFMNLATARSAERAKEVGVRKVVGAGRRQLVGQFLAEAVVLSAFALVLALGLTAAALPAFRALSGKPLPFSVLADPVTVLALLGLTLLVGLGAGGYPAFFLSAFQPIQVLRGSLRRGTREALLRKGLVVFQFATSACLIAGTAVVYAQLGYLRSASLGFDQAQVVVLPFSGPRGVEQYPAFKEALLRRPAVLEVSIASERLPGELLNGSGIRLESAPEEATVPSRMVSVGHGFFETLGVEMVAGRPFSLDLPTDSSALIVNETAFRLLQQATPDAPRTPEEAIGRTLHAGSGPGPIIGIVRDFNLSTLHEAIEPIYFFIRPGWFNTYLVRTEPGRLPEALQALEETWRTFYPERPFAYSFADQAFDAQYRAEERLGRIFTTFSLLAVLIACLGLFGLASFTAERRRKEIGVRKVFGASVAHILLLLSRDFAALVLVALVVAAPVAYFAMDRWLEDFAYRIDIGPGVFLLAGALTLGIALLTVSYQALKAALADPAESLRYE